MRLFIKHSGAQTDAHAHFFSVEMSLLLSPLWTTSCSAERCSFYSLVSPFPTDTRWCIGLRTVYPQFRCLFSAFRLGVLSAPSTPFSLLPRSSSRTLLPVLSMLSCSYSSLSTFLMPGGLSFDGSNHFILQSL